MTGHRSFPFILLTPFLLIFFGFSTAGAWSIDPNWDLCINRDPQVKEIDYPDEIVVNLGELEQWEGQALNLLAKAINAFSQVFDGWPLDVTENPSQPLGVVFETTDSFPGKLASASFPWSLTLLEQTCHFWNGATLQRVDFREKWFESGVNHYYAWKMAIRLGLIEEEDAVALLEGYLDAYLADVRAGKLSMREAGLYGLPGLVTGGGFAVAFALDIQIQSLTQNRFSLDTLMKRMFKTHANHPYDLNTIMDGLEGITGNSFEPFFEKYVDGAAFLPMALYMEKAGFHFELDPFSARVTITPFEAFRSSH